MAAVFAIVFILTVTLTPAIADVFDTHLNAALPVVILVTIFVWVTCIVQEALLRVEFLWRDRLAQLYERAQRLQGETEFLLLNILPVHVVQRYLKKTRVRWGREARERAWAGQRDRNDKA